jgi:hypothetical protein
MNIHHSSQPLSLQMRTPSLFLVASRASKNFNIFKNVATDPRMENQPSRQCPHCQDLTPSYLFVQVPELLEGAKAGCKGCSLLRGAVSKFFPISKIKAIDVSVDCALYIYAYLKDANEYTVIELSSPAGQSSRWKNTGPARPVLPMTHDRSRVVQLIKNWMEDCQLRHPSCRAPLTAPLPTRVIDVGSSSETVCLHISTEGECVVLLARFTQLGINKALGDFTMSICSYNPTAYAGYMLCRHCIIMVKPLKLWENLKESYM